MLFLFSDTCTLVCRAFVQFLGNLEQHQESFCREFHETPNRMLSIEFCIVCACC